MLLLWLYILVACNRPNSSLVTTPFFCFFSCLALANTAIEDVFLFIRDCDGPEWANSLLDRMKQTEQTSYQSGKQSV